MTIALETIPVKTGLLEFVNQGFTLQLSKLTIRITVLTISEPTQKVNANNPGFLLTVHVVMRVLYVCMFFHLPSFN